MCYFVMFIDNRLITFGILVHIYNLNIQYLYVILILLQILYDLFKLYSNQELHCMLKFVINICNI